MAALLRASLLAGAAALAAAQVGYQFPLAFWPYGTSFPTSASAITPALQGNLSLALGLALGCANPAAAIVPTGVVGFIAGHSTSTPPYVFPGYLQIGFMGVEPLIANCSLLGVNANSPQATVLASLKTALNVQLQKTSGSCTTLAACSNPATAPPLTTGFPVYAIGVDFADVRNILRYPDAYTMAGFVYLDQLVPNPNPYYGSPPPPPFGGFAASYATTGVAILIALAFVFAIVALAAYCFCKRCLVPATTKGEKRGSDVEAQAAAITSRVNPAAEHGNAHGAGAGHSHH